MVRRGWPPGPSLCQAAESCCIPAPELCEHLGSKMELIIFVLFRFIYMIMEIKQWFTGFTQRKRKPSISYIYRHYRKQKTPILHTNSSCWVYV